MEKRVRVAAVGDNCMDCYDDLGQSFPGGNPVNVAVYHVPDSGSPGQPFQQSLNGQAGQIRFEFKNPMPLTDEPASLKRRLPTVCGDPETRQPFEQPLAGAGCAFGFPNT